MTHNVMRIWFILCLGLGLRIIVVHFTPDRLLSWEGRDLYIERVEKIFDGQSLYRDIWDEKPPLWSLSYATWAQFFGNNVQSLRSFIIAGEMAFVVLLYLFCFEFFGGRIASIAAAFYAFLPSVIYVSAVEAKYESITFFFMVAAIWAALRNRFIFAGIALGFGVAYKYNVALLIPALLYFFVRGRGLSARGLGTFMAATGLSTVAVFFPFVASAPMKFYQFTLHQFITGQGPCYIPPKAVSLWGILHQYFGVHFSSYWPYLTFVLLVLGIVYFLRKQPIEDSARGLLTLCFVFVLSFLLTIRAGNLQYLNWVLPFESILAAIVWCDPRSRIRTAFISLVLTSSLCTLISWYYWLYAWQKLHYGTVGACFIAITVLQHVCVLVVGLKYFYPVQELPLRKVSRPWQKVLRIVQFSVPVVVYPLGIFRLYQRAVALAKVVSIPLFGRWHRRFPLLLSPLMFVMVCLIPSLMITIELLIVLNSWVLGDLLDLVPTRFHHPVHRFQFSTVGAPARIQEGLAGSEFYQRLAEAYSPVFFQQVGFKPKFDVPVFLDFDGNQDPRDNVINSEKISSLEPGVYGEVTAETKDSYYLTYTLYHVMDYDHPVREFLSPWTFHDNDLEGINFRVDKNTMTVVAGSGWIHNEFEYCNSKGGLIFEGGTHPIFFAQPLGHGMRCANERDLWKVGRTTKVYRFDPSARALTIPLDLSPTEPAGYRLKGFSQWHRCLRQMQDPQDEGCLFGNVTNVGTHPGGEPIRLPIYLRSYKDSVYASHPKPMWAWDDFLDGLSAPFWYFLPAETYQNALGGNLSFEYLHSPALNSSLAMSAGLFKSAILAPRPRTGTRDVAVSRARFQQHLAGFVGDFYRPTRSEYLRAIQKIFGVWWGHVSKELG
ncbi:MAG: glycosyltransferase family 39 protein [Deltaproteobacteria bacterium]|nr:glycosyltransferase family 39 protein [Deltaproteobacteria bacterium]